MKVLGINGSPHAKGNTWLALDTVAETLAEQGIGMEIVHVGNAPVRGCLACGACARNRDGRCVQNDIVNDLLPRMREADALVLGSPVYYAGIAGTMKSFCDRAFYVAGANGGWFAGKVGASVVAMRRAGGSAAFAGLNYYLGISHMVVPGSSYWNLLHGRTPLEGEGDGEGLQTMRNLARSIAWLLKLREAGCDIPLPEFDSSVRTNFIR